MKSPNTIRHAKITNILLAVIFVFYFGIAAYAKPTLPMAKSEAASRASFAPCLLGASPLTPHVSPGEGENFELQVTLLGASGCGWVVSSGVQWIFPHPASGATNQTVFVEVYPNLGSTRVATIKVKGYYNLEPTGAEYTISLTQVTINCSYSFDKTSLNLGGNQSITDGFINVTASNSNCPRNATSNVNWISILSGNNANGSGPIEYKVDFNHGLARTGKITLGNATYTVMQGEGCGYDFSPTSKSFDAAGGSGSINVTATNSACPRNATSSANWITIIGGNNSNGSGPITYTVAPNPGLMRMGQIKLDLATFTITQSSGCTYTLSPSIFNFQPGNGVSSIQVTNPSNACGWFPVSSASWVKITNAAQYTGSGTVNFTTDPNPGAARTATITVGNKTATINQSAGAGCSFTISPGNANFNANGGEVNVNVTASNSSCAWSTGNASAFISVISGTSGTGNGVSKIKVLPNAGAARAGSVLIAGKTFTVTQDGANGAAAMWITVLSPGFASKGGKEFQMTVKGANFVNGCKVRWNGEDRQTSFINGSTLVVTIPAADITDEGVNDVTVAKPNSADETNAEQFMVYGAVANVSSASFKGEVLAPASLVSAFGIDLANELKIADSQPLPTELAGSTVTITDATGKEHKAQLFFVSPGQINYLMPEGVAFGKATVMINSASGHTSAGAVEIAQVAPALFTANSNGQGVATALALRVKANGQQIYEQVAQYDAAAGIFKAKPIDLTIQGEQVYLIFYGTGFRYRNSINGVLLDMGGVFGSALYAGQAPGFVGLDQINVLAPNNLAGRGEVDVVLTVDGKKANTVKLMFK